jgi:hypothetical protein
MQKLLVVLFLGVMSLLLIASDDSVTGDDVTEAIEDELSPYENLINSCGISDLTKLGQQNSFSQECEDALEEFMPQPADNSTNRLIKLGVNKKDSSFELLLAGTGTMADSLANGLVSIDKYLNGNKEILSSFTTEKLGDVSSRDPFYHTVVLDYSGSMNMEEIKEANAILRSYFSAFKELDNPGIMANTVLFSSDTLITEYTSFSNNIQEIEKSITYVDNFPQESTAFYDAIGFAIDSLKEVSALGKMLLVHTDGGDNDSKRFTESTIIDYANLHDVRLIIIGSMMADVSTLKNMAQETGGIYIYAFKLAETQQRLTSVANGIKESLVFGVTEAFPDSVVVTIGGVSISFK